MILTVFPLLLKIVTIILSFFDEQIKDTNLEIPYVKNIWLLPVGIIIYSFLILLKAYLNKKIKWYMDIKYIPSHKLLILYGLIGTLFYLIICTMSTFKECEKTYTSYNSTKNIADYFCEIQEINITNNKTIRETTKYLANFKFYFTNFNKIREVFLEIFAVSFGAVSFFFYEYFSLMIIKYLSPIHLMFTIPLYYSIKKIILTAYVSLSEDKDRIIIYNNDIFKAKFILDSIGDIFCIISNLIYLEILE